MVFLSPIANSSGKRLLEASAKISDLYLPCASRSGSAKNRTYMAKKPQPGATPLKAFTQHQWTARNPLYGCPHGAVIATLRAFEYQWQYRVSGAQNLRCLSRHSLILNVRPSSPRPRSPHGHHCNQSLASPQHEALDLHRSRRSWRRANLAHRAC